MESDTTQWIWDGIDINGKCCVCGKEIPEKPDGQGANMIARIELHHPIYPQLETIYKNRWICHTCVKDIACNIADNDALF